MGYRLICKTLLFITHIFSSFFFLPLRSAGKSTLVNCLTGLLTPTFGNAFIFGESIHNVTKIQQSMGVTMQDDILFDELTTRENLFVFGSIRGIPWSHLASTVNRKLEQFHMESYSEKPVRYQSGGMKRRLSLALATLGEPKMVCLDEPTSAVNKLTTMKGDCRRKMLPY